MGWSDIWLRMRLDVALVSGNTTNRYAAGVRPKALDVGRHQDAILRCIPNLLSLAICSRKATCDIAPFLLLHVWQARQRFEGQCVPPDTSGTM
jgi:hypothetical protein